MSEQNYFDFDGVRYVSAGDAARLFNLTRDYIARLAREEKICGRRVGKSWYVEPESVRAFTTKLETKEAQRREELTQQRRREYENAMRALHVPVAAPVEVSIPEKTNFIAAELTPDVLHAEEKSFTAASPVLLNEEEPAVTVVHVTRKKTPTTAPVHALLAKAATKAASKKGALMHSVQTAPAYAISPVLDFMHRATALITAVVLVFGSYAFADPEVAKPVIASARESIAHGSLAVLNAPRTIATLSQKSFASLSNASALTAAVSMPSSNPLATAARTVNATVDSFFARVVNANAFTMFASDERATVVVSVGPRAQPVTATVVQPRAQATTVITNPVVERVRETTRVLTVGGITESYLDQRLAMLSSDLTSRMLSLTSANSTTINNVYQTVGAMGRIEHLDGLDITNVTITGGTITGVTFDIASVSGILATANGGTGTSSAPSYGQLLMGDGTGGYLLVATSTLGIGAGSGAPGGALNTVQFNSSGLFGGDSDFSFNSSLNLLSIAFASSSAASALDGIFVGRTATTSILANATSTFAAGIQTTALNVTGPTSTFANGINLATGCFAIGGTCIGAGGGGGTWGSITGTLANQTDLQAALDAKLSLTAWYATTTDAIAQGITNRYYADSLVQAFVHASTTIPKTYTANTFTGLQTFTNASSTLFSSAYASSTNQVIGNNLTFGGVTGNSWDDFCTTITGSSALCDGSDDGGGGGLAAYDAWTHPSAGYSATTSILQFPAASTTLLSVTRTAYFGGTATSSFSSTGALSMGGAITFATDNTFDIGASGANRARNIYAAGNGVFGGSVSASQGAGFGFTGTSNFLHARTSSVITSMIGGTNKTELSATDLQLASDLLLGWSGSTIGAANDTALARNAAGVLEINSGTAGALRDLRLRAASSTLFSNTGIAYFGGTATSSFSSAGVLTLAGGLNGPLQANNGVVSATTSIGVLYGGTGITTAPSYGQILVGNASGGYTLTATTSLGINSAVWGSISGTLANQTDLQSALDAKLSLTAWYATTTDALDEGLTNFYFTTNRFATALAGTTTDALAQGSTNRYYSDSLVQTFIHASTTIPKTYTANTFTALQTFANASSTLFSSSYASTTNLIAGNLTLGTFNGPLQANNGVVSATTSILAVYGGTGQTGYATGDILYANSATTLTRLAASTNGLVLKLVGGVPSWQPDITTGGGGGATAFSTTSDSLAIYPTDTSDVFILGGSATSTTNNSILEAFGNAYISGTLGIGTTSPFATLSVAGNIFANGNITGSNITATGTLNVSGQTTLATSLNGPLQAVNGVLSATSTLSINFGGTGTSTAPTYGKLLVGNSAGGFDYVATTSLGINSAVWGSISGTLANQTDLQAALDAKLSLTAWYATTTDALDEGNTNLYFTTNRVATVLAGTTTDALAQGSTNRYYSDSLVNTYIHSSTTIPKTYTANTFTALQTFANASTTLISSTYASSTNAFFGNLSVGTLTGILKATNGVVAAAVPGTDYTNFAYLFPSNATTTMLTFSGGLMSLASTTIGDNTQTGGLTISGGATTTGNAYFASSVGVGVLSPGYKLDVAGFINTDQYSGFKQAGNTVLYASTTNNTLAIGASGAASWMSATATPLYTVAIGAGALSTTPVNASANYNTAIGYDALRSNTSGGNNVAIGSTALYSNTSGSENFALGSSALYSNNGDYNVAIGSGVLSANTSGAYNLGMGRLSLQFNRTGSNNIALGGATLNVATSSSNNTAIGHYAGSAISGATGPVGGNNTLIGYLAGSNVTTGSYNTILGSFGDGSSVTTGSNNILIGQDVRSGLTVTDSNQLNIGNLLFGTGLGSGTTLGTGSIGIGTSSPYRRLSVLGDAAITGSLSAANLTATGTVAFTGLTSGFVGNNNGTLYSFATSTLGFMSSYDAFTHPSAGYSATTSILQFPAASTSLLSVTGTAYFGGTATSSFSSTGALTLATALTVGNGGTGATSFTGGSLLYGSGTGALQVAATSTLAVGGSITSSGTLGYQVGGTNTTLSLNMGNANTWTALQTFANASTTLISSSYASTTNLVAGNATIGTLTGILKATNGVVAAAVPGTDYTNFAYLFPSNATTTLLAFNGGLTTTNATSSNLFSSVLLGSTAKFGATATSTFSSTGALTLGGALTLSGSLNGPLQANGSVVSATTSIGVLYGGTGLTTAPTYGQMLVGNSSGGYTLTATSSLGITSSQWTTSGNNIYYTSGNVGIATTSPYAKLSVAGEIVGANFTATSTTATSTFAGGLNVGNGAITYDYTSGVTTIENLVLGNFTFDTDAGVVTWADMPVTSAATAGTLESYTARIDGTSILSIFGLSDGAGGIYTPSVGIGSTTPWGTFSVEQDATATSSPVFVVADQGTSTPHLLVSSRGYTGFGTTTPWARVAINPIAGDVNQFVVGSSTATSFLINPAGSVGVGTTSPGSLFSVNGVANFRTGTSSIYTGLRTTGNLDIAGTGTSTFANGLNLSSGCIAINGVCIGASNFTYLFPSNATTTLLAFNGGLTTTNATATNLFASSILGTTGKFGATASTTIDSAGNTIVGGTLNVTGNTTLANATSTTFFSPVALHNVGKFGQTATSSFSSAGVLNLAGITSALLKTDGSNNVVAAVAGTDYINSSYKDWNVVSGALTPTTTIRVAMGFASSTAFSALDGFFVGRTSTTTILGSATSTFGAGIQTTALNVTSTSATSTFANGINFTGGCIAMNGTCFTGGQWTTSGNNIYYNTGNVGIGTTTPYAKLSVVGEIVGANFTATSTSATSTFAGGLNVGNGAITYDYSSGLTSISNLAIGALSFPADSGILSWLDMPVTSAATAGTVESYTAKLDGTDVLSIFSRSDGAGGIYTPSVGVGSSTPWGTFSVEQDGTATSSPVFVVGDTGTSTPHLLVSSMGLTGVGTSTPWAKLSITAAGGQASFAIGSSTGSYFQVDASGKVGIATTSNARSAQLAVAGSAFFGGTTGTTTIEHGLQTTALNITSSSATSTFANGISLAAGCVRMPNGTCLGPTDVSTFVSGNGNGSANRVAYWTSSSNITSSSLFTFDGTTLTAPEVTAASVSPYFNMNDTDTTGTDFRIDVADGHAIFNSDIAGTAGTSYLAFANDGTENMRILANGSVGIGTTSPFASFAINPIGGQASNQFVVGSSTATAFLINNSGRVGVGSTTPWAQLSVNGASGINSFTVGSTTGTQFTVSSTSNVGIGTANPSQLLEVRKDFIGDTVAQVNNAHSVGTAKLNLTAGGDTFSFEAKAPSAASRHVITSSKDLLVNVTGSLDFANTFTSRLFINSSGLIGVGTSSPYSQLTVWGSSATGNAFEVVNSASTTLLSIPNLSTGTSTFASGLKVTRNLDVTGTGTSTFSNGINLAAGCFAVNGTCLTSGSGGSAFGQTWEMVGGVLAPTTTLLTNIRQASSTLFSANQAWFGQTATSTFNSTGWLGIGTSSPGSLLGIESVANFRTGTSTIYSNLAVDGDLKVGTGSILFKGSATSSFSHGIQASMLNITGATSSFANGINLSAGCFSVNGTCVGAGGSSGGSGGGQLIGVYATSTAGTTTVNFLGAANAAPSFSGTTLTLPSNTSYVVVELWGGGTGGTQSDGESSTSGQPGGASCFGTNSIACVSSTFQAPAGGALGSSGDVNLPGAQGISGRGGTAPRGGANNDSFGGGGSGSGGAPVGGISGSYSQKYINAPSGTYYYTVGKGGLKGGSSSNGGDGGFVIYVYTTGVSQGAIGAGAAGFLPYYTDNTASTSLSATSSIFLSTKGFFGIGTTSPLTNLDAYGNLSLSGSNRYLLFGATSTASIGVNGYGLRDNAGTIEFKNSTGAWTGIGSGGGGAAFPFTPGTFGSTAVQSTTTALQLTAGLFASSTVRFGTSGLEGFFLDTTVGKVGIGTTSPFRKLSLTDAVSTAQQAIAYDTTRYTDLLTDASGDFTINPSGNDAFLNDDNLWICTGGSCPTGTISGTGNLVVEGKIGVGTSTPAVAIDSAGIIRAWGTSWPTTGEGLELSYDQNTNLGYIQAYDRNTSSWGTLYLGNGSTGVATTSPGGSALFGVAGQAYIGTATSLGTATSTFQGDVKITGKLDVSTIDPPYTIDGTKYATYVASMTGVKEETTMTVMLDTYNPSTKKYEAVINFDDLEEGSDLWLFYQITTFGEKWKDLTVLLTPAFDGTAFYKKNVADNTLTVSGTEEGEVSMRLTAARYDDAKWPNLRPDQDGNTEGTHVISSKPKGGSEETAEVREAKGMMAAVATATAALTEIANFATSTLAFATSTLKKFFSWMR